MTDRVWVLLSVATALVAALGAEVYLFLRDRHEGRGTDRGCGSLTPPVFPGPDCFPQDGRTVPG
jgi:hypothetical protein